MTRMPLRSAAQNHRTARLIARAEEQQTREGGAA